MRCFGLCIAHEWKEYDELKLILCSFGDFTLSQVIPPRVIVGKRVDELLARANVHASVGYVDIFPFADHPIDQTT